MKASPSKSFNASVPSRASSLSNTSPKNVLRVRLFAVPGEYSARGFANSTGAKAYWMISVLDNEGNSVVTGDNIPAAALLSEIGPLEGLGRLVRTLEPAMAESPGLAAACLEFAIEGLWLTRRIDKDAIGGVSRYGAA